MAKVMEINQKIGMVFGKLKNMEFRDMFDEAGSFLTWTGFLWGRGDRTKDIGQYESIEPVLSGKSAACMIRRKVLWETGAFDESYEILAEETDLSWRVWLYGYTVLYVPLSVTYHAFNTKFKPCDFYAPKRVYFNGCRNYLSMLMTNLSDFQLIVPIICQLIAWSVAGMGMLVTGKREAGIYIFKGIFWFFSHLDSIWLKRKKVQKDRKISDRELFKIIRRSPGLPYFFRRLFRYVRTGLHG